MNAARATYLERPLTLMVVEADAGSGRCPAQNGFARHGPDAFFGALLDQDQAVGRHAQQTFRLPHRSASAAEIVDQHLPAHGAALDAVG